MYTSRLTRSLIPILITKNSRADGAVRVESGGDGIAVCAGSLTHSGQQHCARRDAPDYCLPPVKRRTQIGGVCAHGAEDSTGTWQGDGDSCILRSFIICSSQVVRRVRKIAKSDCILRSFIICSSHVVRRVRKIAKSDCILRSFIICSSHDVRRVRKIAKSDYQFRHVWPSVRPMQQFGSHWADFHEIGCLSIFFFKSVKKIQCLIKIRQEERILYMRPIYIYDHISLRSS